MPWSFAIYFEGPNHSILSFLIGKERFKLNIALQIMAQDHKFVYLLYFTFKNKLIFKTHK